MKMSFKHMRRNSLNSLLILLHGLDALDKFQQYPCVRTAVYLVPALQELVTRSSLV